MKTIKELRTEIRDLEKLRKESWEQICQCHNEIFSQKFGLSLEDIFQWDKQTWAVHWINGSEEFCVAKIRGQQYGRVINGHDWLDWKAGKRQSPFSCKDAKK